MEGTQFVQPKELSSLQNFLNWKQKRKFENILMYLFYLQKLYKLIEVQDLVHGYSLLLSEHEEYERLTTLTRKKQYIHLSG